MKGRTIILPLVAFLLLTFANNLLAQKIKVIVDQDARGPATTDMQSILIFSSRTSSTSSASPPSAAISG